MTRVSRALAGAAIAVAVAGSSATLGVALVRMHPAAAGHAGQIAGIGVVVLAATVLLVAGLCAAAAVCAQHQEPASEPPLDAAAAQAIALLAPDDVVLPEDADLTAQMQILMTQIDTHLEEESRG